MNEMNEEKYQTLVAELDEDGFRNLVPLIMQSFEKRRGRTLDKTQVASLAVGLLEMSAVIDSQITMIGELQQQLGEVEAEVQTKRLWRP